MCHGSIKLEDFLERPKFNNVFDSDDGFDDDNKLHI
jgi:hypothetical protein